MDKPYLSSKPGSHKASVRRAQNVAHKAHDRGLDRHAQLRDRHMAGRDGYDYTSPEERYAPLDTFALDQAARVTRHDHLCECEGCAGDHTPDEAQCDFCGASGGVALSPYRESNYPDAPDWNVLVCQDCIDAGRVASGFYPDRGAPDYSAFADQEELIAKSFAELPPGEGLGLSVADLFSLETHTLLDVLDQAILELGVIAQELVPIEF